MSVSQGSGLGAIPGRGITSRIWRRMRRAGRARRSDRVVSIDIGDFTLEAPENHIFVRILNEGTQPCRDLNIGVTARCIAEQYPSAPIVDIGANIGYTAAIMATHAPGSPLVLVEPSDRYFDFLERNSRRLPNLRACRRVFVSDRTKPEGELQHWFGTAMFVESPGTDLGIASEPLPEIAPADTRLVKIDTDGHDFRIIRGSIDWLRETRSAILFENQIQGEEELSSVNELFRQLREIDYGLYIFWDDPGFHVVSTTDMDVVRDLNRYLFKQRQRERGRPSIYNYDVLCLPSEDKAIFERVTAYYQNY